MKTLKEMGHEAVRCDEMVDWDVENKMPGVKATCCVCAGHDCDETKAERLKHPKKVFVENQNSIMQ